MPLSFQERAGWLATHVLVHEPTIRRWLARHCPYGIESDDIVQEAYAVLFAKDDLDQIRDPGAYLHSVIKSQITRHLRRAKIVSIDAVADIERISHSPNELTPERYAGASQELSRLEEILSTLPENCRQAFILARIEGLNQDEIARRLVLSRSSVEKLVARALRLLLGEFAQARAPASAGSRGQQDDDTHVETARY